MPLLQCISTWFLTGTMTLRSHAAFCQHSQVIVCHALNHITQIMLFAPARTVVNISLLSLKIAVKCRNVLLLYKVILLEGNNLSDLHVFWVFGSKDSAIVFHIGV
jgi:hypothetical protein